MKKQWTNFPGLHDEHIVSLHKEAYLNNQRLAVEVVAHEGGAEVPYALVTRNFSDEPIHSGVDAARGDLHADRELCGLRLLCLPGSGV